MPIERDEVAGMILGAFGAIEAQTGDTKQPVYIARQFLDLRRALYGSPQPRFGIARAEYFWLQRLSNPEITRVTIWDPALQDSGTIWNYADFDFPPNPSRFLDEFLRAQNHRLIIETHFHRDDAVLIIDSVALWGSRADLKPG
jgi:hypothetical protein